MPRRKQPTKTVKRLARKRIARKKSTPLMRRNVRKTLQSRGKSAPRTIAQRNSDIARRIHAKIQAAPLGINAIRIDITKPTLSQRSQKLAQENEEMKRKLNERWLNERQVQNQPTNVLGINAVRIPGGINKPKLSERSQKLAQENEEMRRQLNERMLKPALSERSQRLAQENEAMRRKLYNLKS
jgi:hypothetical protein